MNPAVISLLCIVVYGILFAIVLVTIAHFQTKKAHEQRASESKRMSQLMIDSIMKEKTMGLGDNEEPIYRCSTCDFVTNDHAVRQSHDCLFSNERMAEKLAWQILQHLSTGVGADEWIGNKNNSLAVRRASQVSNIILKHVSRFKNERD